MEDIKEVVNEIEKPKKKGSRKPKKIETVDEIIDEVEEDEPVVEKVEKKKSFRELRKELRVKKEEIEVEILNLHCGGTNCRDRSGRLLFDLSKYGDREFITLADLYEVASRNREFFEKHLIAIIDVDSDEYSIEDIIEFVGLNESLQGIEDYDCDYISRILSLKINEFEYLITNASEDLCIAVSSRAVELYKNGNFDSKRKETVLCNRLGREDLFEV